MFVLGVGATNRNCTHVAMHKTLDIKSCQLPAPSSSPRPPAAVLCRAVPFPDLFCPSRGWISRLCAQNANAKKLSHSLSQNKKGLPAL